jgi:hypothetical protein
MLRLDTHVIGYWSLPLDINNVRRNFVALNTGLSGRRNLPISINNHRIRLNDNWFRFCPWIALDGNFCGHWFIFLLVDHDGFRGR